MKDKKTLYLLPIDKSGGKDMIKAELWHEIHSRSVILVNIMVFDLKCISPIGLRLRARWSQTKFKYGVDNRNISHFSHRPFCDYTSSYR